jgi:hypothetical protein
LPGNAYIAAIWDPTAAMVATPRPG